MYQKLEEKDIEFFEIFSDPVAMMECLIPVNFKAPQNWSFNEKCITLRPYQIAMLDYSYMYADDPSLSEKENYQNKIGAGTLYNIGARNIGKSFLDQCNAFFTLLWGESDESCYSSFDFKHLKKACTVVANFAKYHPFFSMWKRKGKDGSVRWTGGGLEIDTLFGHVLYGKNEKVDSDDPGTDYHSLHAKKHIYEEASYMSAEGKQKRVDATSSLGCIERFGGIPDVRKGSPLGEILLDDKKKNWICRLPQMVRCIAKGSKILMADFSTKNIEDIEIGDKVFSVSQDKPHFLQPTIVLNKVYNGIKKTITIDNDVNSLTLTSDHKLFTLLSPMYRTWKSFDELNLEKHKVYYFKNYINNLQEYYEGCFLGILETEGSFKRNKRDKSIGQKVEKKLLEFLLKTLNIKYTKYNDKSLKDFSYYYLKVSNTNYIDTLYSKLEYSKDVQLGFIAGCIYGDGSVALKNGIYNTTSGEIIIVQKSKIELIERILNLSGISYSKRIRQCDTNRGYFDGVTFSFKKFEVPLCVSYGKKSLKYQKLCGYSSLMAIQNKEVKKVDESISEVYDLTTETHSFIANGFIVHNCDWDEKSKQKAIEEYHGENDPSYKLNVLAESIEGAFGRWDMKRVRKLCYNARKTIKFFEFGKEDIAHLDECSNFEEKTQKIYELLDKNIIIDRLPSSQTIIASDIGSSASPSQICIYFGDTEKLKWRYLISLFQLTTQEQARVFKWLYDKLDGAFISLDTTELGGRAIADELEILRVPKEKITRCIMNEKIKVGFELDNNGQTKIDKNGEPIYKYETTLDWACSELDKVFYNGLIELPHCELFFKEFPSYFATKIGNGYKYGSSTTDHLVQSFQVMAICRFYNENLNLQQMQPSSLSFIGGF